MGGRSILLLVSGFSILFLILGQKFLLVSSSSITNYSNYYSNNIAHNIAVSGANLTVNQIFLSPAWTVGYSNVSMSGGIMNATVVLTNPVTNALQVTAIGTFNNYKDTVIVNLQLSYFSKFAYCSNNENGIYWATGDVVNGPFHTQDYINVSGHPIFNPGSNYVGTYKGINNLANSSPTINGTLRVGDNLTIPSTGLTTLDSIATAGGYAFTGHDTVYVTLAADSIKYKFAYNGAWTTKLDTVLAPNRTIIAHNSILRLQGTLKGKLTIGASGSTLGTVYLDNDVVYATDPISNPNSSDLLGIVAQNNVYVTDSPNTKNINIDATIYAQDGGFGAQDWDTRSASGAGTIYLLGGITQNNRLTVASLNNNGTVKTGFSKNYTYDNRLLVNVPPNFPSTGSYTVISWYE